MPIVNASMPMASASLPLATANAQMPVANALQYQPQMPMANTQPIMATATVVPELPQP